MTHRRRLRPEEQELWQAVARTATPLHPVVARHPIQNMPPALTHKVAAAQPAPAFGRFRIGEKARLRPGHDILLPLADRLGRPRRSGWTRKASPACRAASWCPNHGLICMA